MRVALVTVGDELLSGDTVNTNAAWLGERLTERGATVERATVVPDRIADIARVVNEYNAEYDAVVVTGGLGPTHDDVTMDGVAAAFGVETVRNEEALEWLEGHGGYSSENLTEGTAHLPKGAQPIHNEEGVAPGCIIGGVYVLPGVPDEMKAMFDSIAEEFSGAKRYSAEVLADEPESHLVDRLKEVQEQFGVKVGSYPGDLVRLKVESTDEEDVEKAVDWLRERVEAPESSN